MLIASLIMPYFTNVSASELTLSQVIENIQASYPDAEIYIDSSNTISVFVPDPATNPYTYMSTNASSTRQKCPNGGTFIYRYHPPYLFLTSPICLPISKTYMPSEITSAVFQSMTVDGLASFILNLNSIGTAKDKIAEKVLAKFGIALSEAQILFIIAKDAYALYSYLNLHAFQRAMNNSSSGKVAIESTTSDGLVVLYYYSWNNNYVDASPWEDCSPEFYEGVYYN